MLGSDNVEEEDEGDNIDMNNDLVVVEGENEDEFIVLSLEDVSDGTAEEMPMFFRIILPLVGTMSMAVDWSTGKGNFKATSFKLTPGQQFVFQGNAGSVLRHTAQVDSSSTCVFAVVDLKVAK